MSQVDDLECSTCRLPLYVDDRNNEYRCYSCETPYYLAVSDHVKNDRWPDRSKAPNIDPVDAWFDSIELLEPTDEVFDDRYYHSFDAHEVRYHHESRTVLLRKNLVIVTAVELSTARRACKYAVLQTVYSTGGSTRTIAEVCNETGLGEFALRNVIDAQRRYENPPKILMDNNPCITNQHK